ncbi:pleckstrin homology domain-containing family G member 5-like isoform X2 [Mizuhopecten yessoensis]|uniref:pleckstrin homology domain-containing family G member 5-like isoform X2 n=1 Tax=Mizuhopecten yessoensis TaxID=6573 RepID=UPI000B45B86A|nr:pleckstrin homology domain-containing family G member 5-like isoform X2 [Mizuhopecten yessoensis]
MPKKPKKAKILAKQLTRQTSTPIMSVFNKKSKANFSHHPHSASEIFGIDTEGVAREPSPPSGGSRPTSPINMIIPLLEYGFSWPRRKSPFSKSSNKKTVVEIASPDSGCPASPINENDLYSESSLENGSCLTFTSRSPECSSPSSDKENALPDIDAVIASLDDVIDEEDSDDDIPGVGNLNKQKSLSDTAVSTNETKKDFFKEADQDTLDENEKRDVLNELSPINGIIKEGRGSNSKRVRFSLDHQPLRKARSLDFIKNMVVQEPCSWDVTVKMIDIQPGGEDSEESLCTEMESFNIQVCHHPQCTEPNGNQPLLLCKECDRTIHGNYQFSGHLVLDAPKKKPGLGIMPRGISAPTLPHFDGNHSDSEATECHPAGEEDMEENTGNGGEGGDTVDGIYMKKQEFGTLPTAAEMKLKRKKAMKLKRRHTDDGQHVSTASVDSDESEDSDQGQGQCQDNNDIKIKHSRRKSEELQTGSQVTFNRQTSSKSVVNEEYFTVTFGKKNKDMEIVAAIKGISLRLALTPILERRGRDINGINVFVAASKTPLPLDCESFLLGGNTLNIREKEDGLLGSKSINNRSGGGNKGQSSKVTKNSGMGSLRGRTRVMNLSIDDTSLPIHPGLSASISPQGTIGYSEGKKVKERSKLTSLLSPMSKDREKQEQLSDLLNNYSVNIPPMPDLLTLGRPSFSEEIFEIEPHWSSLVDNASSLTKRQHDQQEAVWELLQTEVFYIRSLRVITDLFMCCLINLQSEQLLNEIDTERLFSNIGDIAYTNSSFWENSLSKVLQSSRQSRLPLNPSDMKEGFKQFPDLLSPYTKYFSEQKACADYMKNRYSENELFKTFVVWAETQKQCNRLKLTDLLVKPMQRLTKYSLLLQAILRKTDDEKQRKDVLEMIASVDRFVFQVNASLRQRHEQERLATIMTKIESYEAVEAPNDESLKYLQEYNNNFDLRAPMPGCAGGQTRSLIMQSVLRLKDSQSRLDVECLLFTDLFLICKPSKRMEKYKIIKAPMRVDRIITQELKDKGSFLMIYLNEYHVPVSAFTFHGDQAAVRVWLEHIRKAQALYREIRNPTQGSNSYSYLSGELVEEQVINVTPISPLPLDQPDVVMSRSAGNDPAGQHFLFPNNAAGQSSPGRISPMSNEPQSPTPYVSHPRPAKSHSYHGDEQHHKHVQSSNSVPSFVDSIPDDDRLHIPHSTGSSANSDSSLPDIVDENQKVKLSQRRSSRNGSRYITADHIQDLNKDDKDTSIHKRLSWNYGTSDNDERQGVLKTKTQSSDSLRSIHSSSGVSSTGSLHLSPEEMEYSSNNHGDICTIHECRHDDCDVNELHRNSEQNDISTLFQAMSTSEINQGIVSVDLPSFEKKLTHAQLMKMKKQLLLSSNVEASEV